jgi:iron complex transport system substrate-binding protein
MAALGGAAISPVAGAHGTGNATSSHARIVSLAPSVTETLFAVGAGRDVVGVSEFDNYPPAVRKLPRVGTFLTPNVEAIAALRPTLIIGLANSANQREIHALVEMGYPTLMVKEDSIAEIERSITIIGNRTGHPRQANKVVAGIQNRISKVRRLMSCVIDRRVLMLVGHDPLVAVGRGTFLDQLLALAHGANIADGLPGSWPRISMEYIIAKKPQVILDGQMGTGSSTPGDFWSRFPIIPAVREHRVHGYPTDPTLTPGPRIGETLMMLVRLIHPEAFGSGVVTAEETGPEPARIATASDLAR